jgi:hypothetical protein
MHTVHARATQAKMVAVINNALQMVVFTLAGVLGATSIAHVPATQAWQAVHAPPHHLFRPQTAALR